MGGDIGMLEGKKKGVREETEIDCVMVIRGNRGGDATRRG